MMKHVDVYETQKVDDEVVQEGGKRQKILNQELITIWASKFMGQLAAALYDNRDIDMHAELKHILGSSGQGLAFEALGHRKLRRSTRPFILKPLLKTVPDSKPSFRQELFNHSIVLLRNVKNVKLLPLESYGLPLFGNFPLVDAIVQPNMLIQFTTVKNNHKGSNDNLELIREGLLGPRSTHCMVFVVPTENCETYRFQNGLGDIEQFLSFDEVVTSDDVMTTTAEREKWNASIETIKCYSYAEIDEILMKMLKDPDAYDKEKRKQVIIYF
jgi:hypothetical protein